MSPFTEARMHLAVELTAAGRHPAAARWARLDPAVLLSAVHHVGMVRTAARRGLDLALLPHTFHPDGGPLLDAVSLAARIAPVVPGIGLAPTATVTHTEPFHLSKAIATLDLVSSGRAGWEPAVSRTQVEADLFGRKPAAPAAELWREAADAIEVVVRLWDSWEDDAVIRDAAAGRYIDRDKLHYIDFRGEFFSVKGPSITPRPPQGHPLVVVRADEDEALPVAARWADVVRIAAPDLPSAAAARERIRSAAADAGRDPDDLTVLLDVEVHLAADRHRARRDVAELDALSGAELPASSVRVLGPPTDLADLIGAAVRTRAADGVTLVPLVLPADLDVVADQVVPLLAGRGLLRTGSAGGSLRARFGLSRPANHFAGASS
ncbi:alkanesulfonate monooxygenase SsuD/methylene tetrahydromethanopterin reductase-like flavin-dependent oxidoreductase (luciferase family) [Pseudonocardia hierapolitana]|uniref:Alkanesulfonate monooxygenase SsuD/methylene tetrahydromethanopterin reductase-like flavin-dependent oxidoreductase (Luciferase family) n=1 Tax=Pseudonocardia hierapolitana TaxID=1128676 RepID=A0A561SYB7_9PSEU|nr:LLM class flavin-dependent oxidoreductase [Pseudonocardia hierapolitana]TWF79832.1 alkanesulfonate monooxygenase SsuD/methylene tetrahydromethanopterin reductase-like flavin-dependent oxidoreductase (luciferase family) [Pseudonocardia hierapolitana]